MKLDIHIPEDVLAVFKSLNQAGHQAFLVGGLVRDALLGREGKDFDVATSARPEQVQELFKGFAIPTGLKHGTVTVMTTENRPIEVTTFRGDGKYSDGRHPDGVTFVSSIKEDLSRRDFTMNAIAYDPLIEVIEDPFHGRWDIAGAMVCAVGLASARFKEDGLRAMRAVRQATQLGFDIEFHTFKAISAAHETFRKVSAERVRDELLKILGSYHPARGIRFMVETGLMEIVIPELLPGIGMSQNRFHAHDVFEHSLAALTAANGDEILKLAVLLHDVGKPRVRAQHPTREGEFQFLRHEEVGAEMARGICERLKLSREQTERVVFIVARHMELHDVKPTFSNAALRRFANRIGQERLPDMFAMARADLKGMSIDQQRSDQITAIELRIDQALKEATAFQIKDLAVTGFDVIKLCNLKPGPAVGKKLQELFAKVVENPELNTREKLCSILVEVEA